MLNKISLRLRLTIFMALILTLASVVFMCISVISARGIYSSPVSEGINHMPNIIETQNDEFASKSLIFAVAIIITGTAATYFLSAIAFKPVLELSREVEGLSENELHKRLVVPQSNDEITKLTVSFNNLFEHLERAFTIQKNFSVNAAHELKTPLAGIISSIEVLRMGDEISLSECAETLTDVLTSANRLSMLVGDLLQMNGELADMRCEHFSLKSTIDDITAELASAADNNKISLIAICGDTVLYGEKSLLRRVFYNLIHNGIKYNKQNGSVTVTADESEGNTVITVADTGIGINDTDIGRIFEPFWCVDNSRSHQLGGSGLGLSIVKSIVEKHGGKLTAQSVVGSGTTFIVMLPKKKSSRRE